jgi:3-carboxy-cis,cis-muconate cycloisomerase
MFACKASTKPFFSTGEPRRMVSLLRDRPASSAAMLAVFSDEALLKAALAFETALAQAQASAGLIPTGAAHIIATVCEGASFDIAALAEESAHAGTLAIALLARLRALVAERDGEAARSLHRGASSQDLADTALMLQARCGAQLIQQEGRALTDALARLARTHAGTPALARTLLQPALPMAFGLQVAQWLLAIHQPLQHFGQECSRALVLQLGGAAGTLQGLSLAVLEPMARQLGLEVPVIPWTARRDALAALGCSLAILTGAVGKLARDISLLAQHEVHEAREPAVRGRGGSSSMPHKRNPTGCQVALSAAIRAPGLAAGLLAGLPQEHQRGLGGWQAEAPALATLFELAHGAVLSMRLVVEGLEVDVPAMRANLLASAVGEDQGLSGLLIERALELYRRASAPAATDPHAVRG